MSEIKLDGDKVIIPLDLDRMTPAQVRLVRTFNALMLQSMTTDCEHEFFEGCAELMRVCAGLIKQSHFTRQKSLDSDIPYSQQALEFSMDILQEHIEQKSVVRYDN